jgi:WD40 repeat protein
LASGSDHGCSCLILWDTKSWTITTRIQSHTAAVTAIVDLDDGRHLVTGSYDKKINLFNHAKSQLVMSMNNNRTSVTGMVMSSDKSKLVTSGLDNSLTVWNIIRKHNVHII